MSSNVVAVGGPGTKIPIGYGQTGFTNPIDQMAADIHAMSLNLGRVNQSLKLKFSGETFTPISIPSNQNQLPFSPNGFITSLTAGGIWVYRGTVTTPSPTNPPDYAFGATSVPLILPMPIDQSNQWTIIQDPTNATPAFGSFYFVGY